MRLLVALLAGVFISWCGFAMGEASPPAKTATPKKDSAGKADEVIETVESDSDDEEKVTDAAVPEDFALVYDWCEGSLPPPHHYEYTIRVRSTGKCEIRMTPDYPGKGVPEWRESFKVKPERLAQLHRRFEEQDVYSRTWKAPRDIPIGGFSEWMTVTADGEKARIPAYAADLDANAVYGPVRKLVPKKIWKKLDEQREAYKKEHARQEQQ